MKGYYILEHGPSYYDLYMGHYGEQDSFFSVEASSGGGIEGTFDSLESARAFIVGHLQSTIDYEDVRQENSHGI